MIIDVFGASFDGYKGAAPVEAADQGVIRVVDDIEAMGIEKNFLIIVRTGTAGHKVAALLEGLTVVLASKESSLAIGEFDGGVDDIAMLRRDPQRDLSFVATGKTLGQLSPRLTSIGRFMDARFRAGIKKCPDGAVALVGRGVHCVRVLRIDHNIGDACVGSFAEDIFPGGAAIGGFKQPAFASGRPKGALGSDEDDVRVAGIDQDLADVLGLLESHIHKRATSILAAVDPIAEADMSTADILAGPNPYGVAVMRIDCHATDGVGRFVVKNRSEGGTGVGRFPKIAGSNRDVPGVGLFRIEGDVGDPTCHEGGADASEF